MNNFEVFFNTRLMNYQGITAWIGDWGLTPVRYLFNGRDVAILSPDEMHHVASFHAKGKENRSSTSYFMMWSEAKSMQKTLLAIVCLIPGLVLSIFKLISYLFTEIREKHQIILDHFSPLKEGAAEKLVKHDFRTNREIGTKDEPITSTEQLAKELAHSRHLPSGDLVDALIIHGDGKLKIVTDPGILAINPLKLILEGAELLHPVSDERRLDDLMAESEEWEISRWRTVTKETHDCPNDGVKRVSTVQEALAAVAPRKRGAVCACERYRQVFVAPRPLT
jgi:hypothetical protein